MRRQMALIRELLIELENGGFGLPNNSGFPHIVIQGYTDEEVRYHAALLVDGGYAKYKQNSILELERLTFKGHDFLELIKDDEVWAEARNIIKEKTGAVETSTDILTEVIKSVIFSRSRFN